MRSVLTVALSVVLTVNFAVFARGDVRNLISVCEDGTLIAAGSSEDMIHLYDGATLNYLHSVKAPRVKELRLSADGKSLAIFTGRELSIVHTKSGKVVRRYDASLPVAFSDDGRWCLCRVAFPKKQFRLVSMETGETKHLVTYPERTTGVQGLGFSPNREHFILVRQTHRGKTKDRKTEIIRYAIEDATPSEPLETEARPPKKSGGGVLTLRDGYMIESGAGTWAVAENGSTTNIGEFPSITKSSTHDGVVLTARPRNDGNPNGVVFSLAATVQDLKAALKESNSTFAEIPYDRLKPAQSLEQVEGIARQGTKIYLTNRFGAVFCVSDDGKLQGIGLYPADLEFASP